VKILVVSPHCDDAAFSLTEHILTWVEDGHDVEIYTVYGGMPADAQGRDKHRKLDEEHRKVVAALGVSAMRSSWLDDVYEPRPTHAQLRESVKSATSGFDVVVGPTGIHHPDHVATAAAVRGVRGLVRVWTYDEIPYYVQHPSAATIGLERIGSRQHLIRKKEICALYSSQINDDLLRCLWAPERCWVA